MELRLEWNESHPASRALSNNPQPTPERVSRPVAKSPTSTMAWGWDADGEPVWVRRWPDGRPENALGSYREAADALASIDVAVPGPVAVPNAHTLVLVRRPWVDDPGSVSSDLISSYVLHGLEEILKTGRLVLTGKPHVTWGGTLVIEDIVGVLRLEQVDRCALFHVLAALVRRDRTALAAAISAVRGSYDDRSDLAVRRCTAGLLVEWTPTSFAVALREIARALTAGGAGCAYLFEAVTSEVIHRLDLAHDHQVPVRSTDVRAVLDRCRG